MIIECNWKIWKALVCTTVLHRAPKKKKKLGAQSISLKRHKKT